MLTFFLIQKVIEFKKQESHFHDSLFTLFFPLHQSKLDFTLKCTLHRQNYTKKKKAKEPKVL